MEFLICRIRHVTIVQMKVSEMARKIGSSEKTIRDRRKAGWTDEKILSTPPKSIEFQPTQDVRRLMSGGHEPTSSSDPIVIVCPQCRKNVRTTSRAVVRTLRKRGFYSCGKCVSRSPEGRRKRSEQSKEAWGNPDIREAITESIRISSNTAVGRAQRSSQSKKAWEDESFASAQRDRIGEMFRSEGHRKLVSERN